MRQADSHPGKKKETFTVNQEEYLGDRKLLRSLTRSQDRQSDRVMRRRSHIDPNAGTDNESVGQVAPSDLIFYFPGCTPFFYTLVHDSPEVLIEYCVLRVIACWWMSFPLIAME